MNRIVEWLIKKRIIVGSIGTILVIGAGSFAIIHHYHEQEVQAEVKLSSTEKRISELLKQTKACFYDSSRQDYLALNLTNQKIVSLQQDFQSLSSTIIHFKDQKRLSSHYDEETKKLVKIKALQQSVASKLKIQMAVNNLFASPVINGNAIMQNVGIANDLTQTKIDRIKLKAFSKQDSWTSSINNLLTQAKNQLHVLQEARLAVDKAVSSKTKADLEQAKKLVEKILNKKYQDELKQRLATIVEQPKQPQEENSSSTKKQEEIKAINASSTDSMPKNNQEEATPDPKIKASSDSTPPVSPSSEAPQPEPQKEPDLPARPQSESVLNAPEPRKNVPVIQEKDSPEELSADGYVRAPSRNDDEIVIYICDKFPGKSHYMQIECSDGNLWIKPF